VDGACGVIDLLFHPRDDSTTMVRGVAAVFGRGAGGGAAACAGVLHCCRKPRGVG